MVVGVVAKLKYFTFLPDTDWDPSLHFSSKSSSEITLTNCYWIEYLRTNEGGLKGKM